MGGVVEAYLQAGRRVAAHEGEVVRVARGDEGGGVGGGGEGGVDVRGEARFAVVEPGEGEFETVGSAAALEGQIGEVVNLGIRVRGFVVVEEVAGR